MPASHIPASLWTQEDEAEQITDDTTVDDLYEMQRLDSLTSAQRDLAAKHTVDQFEAVPSYFNRHR